MKNFLDQFFIEGNQSYLLRGDKDAAYEALCSDTRAKHHAVTPFLYERLSIDDVRSIKQEASLLEGSESDRTLYIGATDVGIEAEQALLKLLEEPPQKTKILFVTQKTKLLDTIQSRVVDLGTFGTEGIGKSKLLPLSPVERLAYIQKLTKESDDVDASKKEIKQELRILLDVFRTRAKEGEPGALQTLRELLEVSEALETRGAPTKMLLEHISLVLS